MIKAYIYGTPKGFDFYPQDRTFEDYLKDFYRTSRKGKRLMVNRRANGETVYSYLRYGLMEFNDMLPDSTERKPGRPNSFFGMSLVLDNNVYCPDFGKLFGWFDYLFDQILKEGIILKYTRSGIIQYQIAKFQDNESAVSNLRVKLPNIFLEEANTAMAVYDESFNGNDSAQIPLLNSEIESSALLNAFKKNTWLAISPDFAKGNGGIDIDCLGLQNKQNEINKRLVTFAVRRNENDIPALQQMDDYIKYAIGIINNYLNNPFAEQDKSQQCSTLLNEYNEMHSNTVNLIESIDSDTPHPTPSETKLCVACHQQKTISEFKNPNDPVCAACSASKSQCHRCGQYKPKEAFRPNDGICRMCRDREYVSIWTTIQEWLSKNSKITGLVVASCLLTAVFAIMESLHQQNAKIMDNGDPREELIAKAKQNVDNYITEHRFIEAENYLDTCLVLNIDSYKTKIYEEGEKALWLYINNNIKDNSKAERFYKDHLETLKDKDRVNGFHSIIELNKKLCSIMQKSENTKKEHDDAVNIINDPKNKYNTQECEAALPPVAESSKKTNPEIGTSTRPKQPRDIVIVVRDNRYEIKKCNIVKIGDSIDLGQIHVNEFIDILYDEDYKITFKSGDSSPYWGCNKPNRDKYKGLKQEYHRNDLFRCGAEKAKPTGDAIYIENRATGSKLTITVTILQ